MKIAGHGGRLEYLVSMLQSAVAGDQVTPTYNRYPRLVMHSPYRVALPYRRGTNVGLHVGRGEGSGFLLFLCRRATDLIHFHCDCHGATTHHVSIQKVQIVKPFLALDIS